MKNRNDFFNAIVAISLMAAPLSGLLGASFVKYAEYAAPLIGSFLLCFHYGIKKIHVLPCQATAFLLLVAYAFFSSWNLDFYTVSYMAFWLSAVAMLLPAGEYDVNFNFLNLVLIVAQLAVLKDVHLNLSMETLMTADYSTTETNAPAFVVAMFFTYQLFKRNWLFVFLNFVLLFLFAKRIIFIALLVNVAMYLVSRRKHGSWLYPPQLSVYLIVNSIYLFGVIAFVNGDFNEIISNLTGLSAGAFTMGRDELYSIIVRNFVESDFLGLMFGHGAASCFHLLHTDFANDVHCDILKLAYDEGLVVFCAFFYLLYKNVRTWLSFALVVMLNIFFLTDNTLIYMNVIMVFLLMQQKEHDSLNVETFNNNNNE